MGRVRRYKKFKSCDPFAKAVPVVIDPKYDQTPSDLEDDFSADEEDFGTGKIRVKNDIINKKAAKQLQLLEDIDKSSEEKMLAKNKSPVSSSKVSSSALSLDKDKLSKLSKRSLKRLRAKADTGVLGLAKVQHEFQQELRDIKHIKNVSSSDIDDSNKHKKIKLEGRKEGESMRKFVTRVRKDAQNIMKETRDESSTTRKKKQEFLDQKKEKKAENMKGKDFKKARRESQVPKDEYLPSAPKVVVGLNRVPEALMAPPVFSSKQLPRHAAPKSKLQKQEALGAAGSKKTQTFSAILGKSSTSTTDSFRPEGSGGKKQSSKEEMERMRERVIGEYKAFKEKKRAQS